MPDTLSLPVRVTESMSSDDLIRLKWRLEAELRAVRQELQSRDARAVDEALTIKETT